MIGNSRGILMMGALVVLMAGPAWAQQPNFGPAIYADGQVWGTKGTTELPEPRGNNDQSFDPLFMFVNGAPGQLPVSEAAPGNRAYNGGRWVAYTALWTMANPPVLMSYDEVMMYVNSGDLAVVVGRPGPGPVYFQCPLLPVR